MSLDPLLALSALDGRYRSKIEPLTRALSEFGLLHARVEVECRWFQALASCPSVRELPELDVRQLDALRKIYQDFSLADARAIKEIEARTNHDVKAVEYFVKDRVGKIADLANHIEFVHFACTSEDI
ncbi:MAG: adenylosuccinate lyase, partial [Pseudomonadales bacterium]|nr:adenylosuccinate lyase [Pseudomonadales bacterium]